jgi:hypothetical protein
MDGQLPRNHPVLRAKHRHEPEVAADVITQEDEQVRLMPDDHIEYRQRVFLVAA